MTGGEVWPAMSSNQWTHKLFLMESAPPGLELKNSFAALGVFDFCDHNFWLKKTLDIKCVISHCLSSEPRV